MPGQPPAPLLLLLRSKGASCTKPATLPGPLPSASPAAVADVAAAAAGAHIIIVSEIHIKHQLALHGAEVWGAGRGGGGAAGVSFALSARLSRSRRIAAACSGQLQQPAANTSTTAPSANAPSPYSPSAHLLRTWPSAAGPPCKRGRYQSWWGPEERRGITTYTSE